MGTAPLAPTRTPFSSPAEGVLAADLAQLQAVGLLLVFVGAVGHDGLPTSLRAALGLAGAEEQPVAELGRDAVQEEPQGFVATLLAASVALVGVLLAAGGNVGRALPLAAAVEVAGFGRVQARVAVFLWVRTVEGFGSRCEYP